MGSVRAERWWHAGLVVATVGVAVAAVAGCGSGDDPDEGADDSTAEEVEQLIESGGARALGEALRVILIADDAFDEHPLDVDVLRENVDDMPGEPEISGIEDQDDDGLDDDGDLEVHLDDEVACVSISKGGGVDVHGGAC